MVFALALLASFSTAFANFWMRKNLDKGGTSKAFLMIQMSLGFLVAILLNPIRTSCFSCNIPILCLGLIAGTILGSMMYFLGKMVEKGPSALSFAILSSATVLPGLIMAIFFGKKFGFEYQIWHGLGSILVVMGLFWAGWNLAGMKNIYIWLIFSVLAFTFHAIFLALMQWRAMIINYPTSYFSTIEASSPWLMPTIYLSAASIQIFVFFKSEQRIPFLIELRCGFLGAMGNSLSTFFLILATEKSIGVENAIIFPIFSVGIIVLCNIWAQRFYSEKVNWRANQLCIMGLFIATIDWKAVLSFLNIN